MCGGREKSKLGGVGWWSVGGLSHQRRENVIVCVFLSSNCFSSSVCRNFGAAEWMVAEMERAGTDISQSEEFLSLAAQLRRNSQKSSPSACVFDRSQFSICLIFSALFCFGTVQRLRYWVCSLGNDTITIVCCFDWNFRHRHFPTALDTIFFLSVFPSSFPLRGVLFVAAYIIDFRCLFVVAVDVVFSSSLLTSSFPLRCHFYVVVDILIYFLLSLLICHSFSFVVCSHYFRCTAQSLISS